MPNAELQALQMARRLVDSLPDAAILLDTNLDAVHYNAAFVKLTGQRVGQLSRRLESGQSVFDLVGQSPQMDRRNAELCLSTRQAVHLAEIPVENTLGESFIMLQSFIPVTDADGNVYGTIESLRDMSDEARIHVRYKELLALEKARAEELERQVAERTRQLAAALEEVTRLSRVDPLTSLLNRRSFFEHAKQAIGLAQRHQRCAAVMMCDLDDFKQLNDTYGHQAGDLVLAATATHLEKMVRKTDKVARYGGEEFIILLTETDGQSVMNVAQRCINGIRNLPISSIVPERASPLTISIGVALYPEHGRSLDQLISCADKALYRAKKAGKDCVILYSADEDRPEEGLAASKPLKPRVLLVDASPDRASHFRDLLSIKYDVVLCSDGAMALAYCERQPFDVVIADDDVATERGADFLDKTIHVLPRAVRILLIESEEMYLDVRGGPGAYTDFFILRNEGEPHLLEAIETGLLRKRLPTQEMARAEGLAAAKGAAAIEALDLILDTRALSFHYQPIVRSSNLKNFACEALCRVDHPSFANPRTLFETASQAGMLWELGRLVRELVAKDLPRIPEPLQVFINLHPSELGDQHLLDGEPFMHPVAQRVVFEISERTAIPDTTSFKRHLTRLRQLGYGIALDDLGAGIASLSSASLMGADFIKIDMTLLRDIHANSIKQRLVRSIVNNANQTEVQVVAQGVETANEATMAIELGCHLLQGYYFGKPAPLKPGK